MLVGYSPALQTLGRVVADEYRALLGALLVVLILLLFASAGMYLLERDVQPDRFGSIPQAAWWALSTLTTVGYGDVVPVTPLGKVLGGVVMLLGVGMIALPVAIIATTAMWPRMAPAAIARCRRRDRALDRTQPRNRQTRPSRHRRCA